MSTTKAFASTHPDRDLWGEFEPRYRELLTRSLECCDDLERLLLDRSDLDAEFSSVKTGAFVGQSRDTKSEGARALHLHVVQDVAPKVRELSIELDTKILASRFVDELDPAHYRVLVRNLRSDAAISSKAVSALVAEAEVLAQTHTRVAGDQSVEVDGESLTMPQAEAIQEEAERARRERAWKAVAARRLKDKERIDELFGQLVDVRHRMAQVAGFADFVDYSFPLNHRFEYGAEECEALHESILEICTPAVAAERAKSCEHHGLERLRPWDLVVNSNGAQPLRPFIESSELAEKITRAFRRLDPELGRQFESLQRSGDLDLDSRPHKASGGYMAPDDLARRPFILMNTTGSDSDVETLAHEAGHAFHVLAFAAQPLLAYRDPCAEACEFASMSMELLTLPYMDEFYEGEELKRCLEERRFAIVRTLTWLALLDAFQHWVYRHPGHSSEDRGCQWAQLYKTYFPGCDWSGYEDYLACEWQRVPHFFGHPMYLISYVVAQLGALQLWSHALEDEKSALANYKRALALGGSVTLPEMFQAAGCEFDLSTDAVRRVLRLSLTPRA